MPPLDDADRKFIGESIAAALTGDAVTKLVAESIGAKIGALGLDKVGEQLKALGGKVETLEKAPKVDPKDDKPDDKGKKGEDPGVLALRAELDALKKQAEADKAKLRTQAQDVALRDALTAASVPADRHALLMPYLRASGVLVEGEDGALTMKVTKHGHDGVQVPLTEGIAAFVKTDAGKVFLPPSGTQGSGDTKQSSAAPRNSGGVDWDKLAADFIGDN